MHHNSLQTHIRWMIRRDMPQVLAIENQSSYPWSEEDFLKVLRQRKTIGMVVEVDDQISAYMIYDLHANHIALTKMAVHSAYDFEFVASRMIDKLIGKLSGHRRLAIVYHVRESDLNQQIFLRSQKFQALEIIPEYFTDTGEDAYFMQYDFKE